MRLIHCPTDPLSAEQPHAAGLPLGLRGHRPAVAALRRHRPAVVELLLELLLELDLLISALFLSLQL